MAKDYIVIDVETGGLDPEKHSLLSLGCVFVKEGKVVEKKEWLLKSHDGIYNVTPEAMIVNNYDWKTHRDVAVYHSRISHEFIEILEKTYSLTDKPKFIGHNIAFDLGFLYKNLFEKKYLERYVSHRVIDTSSIMSILKDSETVDFKSCSLKDGILHYGLEVKEENLHTALYDAEKTWELYKCLVETMGGKNG